MRLDVSDFGSGFYHLFLKRDVVSLYSKIHKGGNIKLWGPIQLSHLSINISDNLSHHGNFPQNGGQGSNIPSFPCSGTLF